MKMKCEQYWLETCVMQFGDITVATVSIEDRPDLVIYLVWSPPGWRSVEVHCSQHGRRL